MLKVTNLSKTFQKKTILKDLDFEIDHGEIAIFLGESGAGKSTLLRMLNNLETFDTGSFTLDGFDLNLTEANRSHTVGMVFQHFNLFEHLNVEDNIILTLMKCKGIDKTAAGLIANTLLRRYELQNHAKARISNLSGGQKQRLAIARTLAVDPKIICLDEPTSALDPRLTSQVAKFIRDCAKENRIVILTTHDMNLLEQLDGEIFLMKEGAIIESTSKSEYNSSQESWPEIKNFLEGFSELKIV